MLTVGDWSASSPSHDEWYILSKCPWIDEHSLKLIMQYNLWNAKCLPCLSYILR
uniref:Ovule protein n=1 Tax=Mesocestoides corti TaxID=53468 RepID=A0A5K3FTM2_MESCO